MAGVMLVFYILLICQIILGVKCDNITRSPRAAVLDAKGRVVEVDARIVGGEGTDIRTYPFAVSVQWSYRGSHHCGGTYILPRFVLSAAHCLVKWKRPEKWHRYDPKLFVIVAGSTDLEYTPTWQIGMVNGLAPHPRFNYLTKSHDLGIIRMTKAFRITPYVGYAPTPLTFDLGLYNNKECTVVGWGTTQRPEPVSDLQHVKVPLIPPLTCQKYFQKPVALGTICAGREEGGVDACYGDSGGPLICNGTQVGIVSYGYGCAAPRSPGVYTRVDRYVYWIYRTTRKNNAFPNKSPSIVMWIGVIYSMIITKCSI